MRLMIKERILVAIGIIVITAMVFAGYRQKDDTMITMANTKSTGQFAASNENPIIR